MVYVDKACGFSVDDSAGGVEVLLSFFSLSFFFCFSFVARVFSVGFVCHQITKVEESSPAERSKLEVRIKSTQHLALTDVLNRFKPLCIRL